MAAFDDNAPSDLFPARGKTGVRPAITTSRPPGQAIRFRGRAVLRQAPAKKHFAAGNIHCRIDQAGADRSMPMIWPMQAARIDRNPGHRQSNSIC
jgi:hypothetical protein